ncbi:hypothetical protein AWZ03_014358 [Drosophila navojoa]|uniref:phenylalanine--tRNA ligase n=1 Tax=Drosophila navojoa TaxID=7232 RepID=A0A484ARL0_DRONA|nr:phenylalanine--tRNA ligase alpha subunit-like [Drosophila navojoa]TDG39219.1 hypothetical protein AWZ03_014358 [Drosophila navojoa]
MSSSETSELTERILKYLEGVEQVDSLRLAEELGIEHQLIVGAVKSIQAHGERLLHVEPVTRKSLELTEEGQEVAQNGSHEANVFASVPEEGIKRTDLLASGGASVCLDRSVEPPLVRRKVSAIRDPVLDHLLQLSELSASDVVEFKRLVQEPTIESLLLSKGPEFGTALAKLATDLTMDMLTSGEWEELPFKPYNFDALGAVPARGHLHPLLKMRSEFRQIFLEMGFAEMATNNYVEPSFWNFDSLFQPQQHPARDAHDTFYVKQSTGSRGYGYNWQLIEAEKNLLRTHTTAVSARTLYQLATRPNGFKPAKFFTIDKVFRNEALDATHLAEFHQVEGVIANVDFTLGDLIGTLQELFRKLGIEELQFKPTYSPYTEPSMEIYCYHSGLAEWLEVGNSGIFRPELVLPMGLPPGVNVLAWGLSLERPTMIKYGINNISDLVGPRVDLKMVEDGPICRLDHN